MNHGWRFGRMPPTQHCVVFPNISGAGPHQFLDTGIVLDQHSAPVVISDVAIIEMAKLLGYVSRGTLEQMQEVIDEQDAEINRLLEENEKLKEFKAAVRLISDEKKKALAEAK